VASAKSSGEVLDLKMKTTIVAIVNFRYLLILDLFVDHNNLRKGYQSIATVKFFVIPVFRISIFIFFISIWLLFDASHLAAGRNQYLFLFTPHLKAPFRFSRNNRWILKWECLSTQISTCPRKISSSTELAQALINYIPNRHLQIIRTRCKIITSKGLSAAFT